MEQKCKELSRILTTGSLLTQFQTDQEMLMKAYDAAINKGEAASEMARWLVQYWEDAGWCEWSVTPSLFKARLMEAFPPLEELDGLSDNVADISSLTFEIRAINTLRAYQESIRLARRHHVGHAEHLIAKGLGPHGSLN